MGRLNEAKVSMPGGCVIGARPIDLHLKGMRDLGAKVRVQAGYVHAKAQQLTGGESFLGGRCGPTVLGTANVMMAATLARGTTVIHSAACEPEIEDLANFLIAMGAKISGAGSRLSRFRAYENSGARNTESFRTESKPPPMPWQGP